MDKKPFLPAQPLRAWRTNNLPTTSSVPGPSKAAPNFPRSPWLSFTINSTRKGANIKEKLIAAGVPAIDGEFFRATVSHSEREVRDDVFKAFVEQLILKNTTPQYRRAHTRQVTQTSVRVVARVQRKAVS